MRVPTWLACGLEIYCNPLPAGRGTTGWRLNSGSQTEYAMNIVFHRQADLAAIYQALARTAIHSLKLDHMANRRAFEAPDHQPIRHLGTASGFQRDQSGTGESPLRNRH